jgi:cell division protein ZapE
MFHQSPIERYHSDLNERGFEHDSAQFAAVTELNRLYQSLRDDMQGKGLIWSLKDKLGLVKHEPIEGLYMWGGVGRGKTYLMDLFYDALPFENKLRTHFHRFMRQVHAELKLVEQEKNPLEHISVKFAERYKVICFDEFFVVDITDAMILANLLDGLFRRGVTLVATSNIEPEGLYKDGLQRARFLPAISLLKQHTKVMNVDGGTDYRLRTLKQSKLYYSPHDETTQAAMERSFLQLCPDAEHIQDSVDIEVEGRSITALKEADDVVWFDFYALCDGPRSQNDYIELAREYHTVLVSNVPTFSSSNDDQARRFIYLVDEFYDRRVKLILSAAEHFIDLYREGRLAFEFERTQSRLQEMQSEDYLAEEHKGG